MKCSVICDALLSPFEPTEPVTILILKLLIIIIVYKNSTYIPKYGHHNIANWLFAGCRLDSVVKWWIHVSSSVILCIFDVFVRNVSSCKTSEKHSSNHFFCSGTLNSLFIARMLYDHKIVLWVHKKSPVRYSNRNIHLICFKNMK